MRKVDMYNEYKDSKPLAVFCLTNFGGVEILDVIDSEYVIIRVYDYHYHRLKLYDSKKGPRFTLNKSRYYLNDFLRV